MAESSKTRPASTPASQHRARSGGGRGREPAPAHPDPPPQAELAARIAILYECYCYDLVADMAQAVAIDAVRSPLKYRNAVDLEAFYDVRTALGSRSDQMNATQRGELYGAVFAIHPIGGARGSATAFDIGAAAVRRGASDVTAAVYGPSAEALLSVLVTESQGFMAGAIVPWRIPVLDAMTTTARANVESAANLLRDPGVATAYGKDAIANSDWPFALDPAGAELVGEIALGLGSGDSRVVSGTDFIKLQRVAQTGRRAIEAVGDLPDDLGQPLANDADVQRLLAAVVAWQRALVQLPTDATAGG